MESGFILFIEGLFDEIVCLCMMVTGSGNAGNGMLCRSTVVCIVFDCD